MGILHRDEGKRCLRLDSITGKGIQPDDKGELCLMADCLASLRERPEVEDS